MTFGILIALHIKRKEHPTNFYLLLAFTVVESFMVAAITTFYDSWVVIKAAMITCTVFFSLSMYTFNSKKDYATFFSKFVYYHRL